MKTTSKQRGFTLLEVMIALLVLALAMAAMIRTASTSAFNTAHIRDKTFAHWVAMNQLEDMRLINRFPDIGESSSEVEMANQRWRLTTKISETPEQSIRRVDVYVRRDQDPEKTSVTILTGFLGKSLGASQ